jgi:phage shock protein C
MWNKGTSTLSPEGVGVKTCPYCAEEIQEQAVKCKHCLSWVDGGAANFASPGSKLSQWRLVRTTQNRKILGVCGGFARMLGIDPTLVRVAFALTTVFTMFLPGILAYAIMAWAIPNEDQAD